MFAGMIFRQEPFFHGQSNNDQLVKIACVLGTKDLYEYVQKYGLVLKDALRRAVGTHSRKSWDRYKTAANSHLVTPDALDLLDTMLVYDHQMRITAKKAMEHPFFDEVRGTGEANGMEVKEEGKNVDTMSVGS